MSIMDDIRAIQQRDPADPTFLEVCLGYNGFHAILLHRMNHAIWGMGFRGLARFLANISRIITGVEIHPEAYIGKRMFIDHGTGVVIGQTAIVGDDVTIYQGVTLGGYGKSTDKNVKRHPTVMNHAMIGAYAQILGDLVIGSHAKVGANSVVTSDIPDNATAIGIPARILGHDDGEARAYGMPSKEEIERLSYTFESIAREVERRKTQADDKALDITQDVLPAEQKESDEKKPKTTRKKSAAS